MLNNRTVTRLINIHKFHTSSLRNSYRSKGQKKMGKKAPVSEASLVLPRHSELPASIDLIDTHLHLLSTFTAFRSKFPASALTTVQEFARTYLSNVASIVDVWCEAPVERALHDFAGIAPDEWPFTYNFVVGVHPHNAKDYSDKVEQEIEEAAALEQNVGIGEIKSGLDYHYDNSPRQIQKDVLQRQLKLAMRLGKPLTIHTREADDDIYNILTEILPKDYKLHIHCYTDSLELCQKLLDHFPNVLFGITGVVTYTSNHNTTACLKHMATLNRPPPILLETDSPFMTPTNLPFTEMGLKSNSRIPISHSGMLPWTASWIASVLGQDWDVAKASDYCIDCLSHAVRDGSEASCEPLIGMEARMVLCCECCLA